MIEFEKRKAKVGDIIYYQLARMYVYPCLNLK